MNKGMIILLLLCMLVLESCNTAISTEESAMQSIITEENFLAELETEETENDTEQSEINLPVYVGSGTTMITDALDNEKSSIARKTVIYTGEDISIEFYLKFQAADEKIETVTATFFLLNDGIPQPFYFENATQETMYSSITCDKNELAKDCFYKVRFQPAYVPYGKKTCMSLVVVVDNNYHFTYPTTISTACCSGIPFYVTAESVFCAVERDEEIPVFGAPVEFEWKHGEDSSVNGAVAVTEKIIDSSQLPEDTAFTSGGPLYATFAGGPDTLENEEIQLFAFVDGKPAALFEGSWYCSAYINPNQLYEIPLDMSQVPSGEHLIYFLRLMPECQYYMMKYDKTEDAHNTISDAATVYDVIVP